MSLVFDRALSRYADRVYRVALLRDARPKHAERATIQAFQAVDWPNVNLDERLEGTLIAALPRPGRTLRRIELAPLPARFWRLSDEARVALILRLSRGYSSAAIAAVIHRSPDHVRELVLDSLSALSGDNWREAPVACRTSRLARVDDAATERVHLLACETCRASAARASDVDADLATSIEAATANARLSRTAIEEIRASVLAQAAGPRSDIWRSPVLLSAIVAVAVAVVITALVVPRSTAQPLDQVPTTAREVLAAAIERYGTPPPGSGVVHQRFEFNLREPRLALKAETWTDVSQPARHRMQLTSNNIVQEWQVGDGADQFRYLTTGTLQSCGRTYPGAARAQTTTINRWRMATDEQAAMRNSRWRFGPWAAGLRYMEQAHAADQLRSLGVAMENDVPVLTLAAEGPTINGTLLIRLDSNNGSLREVREVLVINGVTRAHVAWRLVSEETIDLADARRSGVLLSYPTPPRPAEVDRAAPVLDHACPLWGTEHAHSLMSTLQRGSPTVIGLADVPAEIDRIYLAGPRRSPGSTEDVEYLRLNYVGPDKRLSIVAVPGLTGPVTAAAIPTGSIPVGNWVIDFRWADITGLRGYARPAPDVPGIRPPAFSFSAEGWTDEELLDLLASARPLVVDDLNAQRELIFDPDAPPVAIGTPEGTP
jgi:hypothetical protein